MHVARVVVHAVVGLMLVLIARVMVIVFVVESPMPVFCIRKYTLYRNSSRWKRKTVTDRRKKKKQKLSQRGAPMIMTVGDYECAQNLSHGM